MECWPKYKQLTSMHPVSASLHTPTFHSNAVTILPVSLVSWPHIDPFDMGLHSYKIRQDGVYLITRPKY